MRRFLGFAVSVAAVFSFVSCGARDDASDLSSLKKHKNPGHHNDHSDTLPGQVNGRVDGRFPEKPHADVTPGTLCQQADTYRYPEHIKYCERSVEGDLKAQIFVMYDEKFGYETTKMQRGAFKIDHLIPLCMGGSNDITNLWPQHVKIYENTDPVEPFLCDVLSQGRIKQAEAVKLILAIKQTPFTAGEELRKLEAKF